MKVILSEGASSDLTDIATWYEEQRPGEGVRFKEALLICMENLSLFPEMHALVDDGVRCAVLVDYPYSIYYEVGSVQVEVLAIFHDSRRPGSWQLHDGEPSWMSRPEMQIAS